MEQYRVYCQNSSLYCEIEGPQCSCERVCNSIDSIGVSETDIVKSEVIIVRIVEGAIGGGESVGDVLVDILFTE